MELCASGLLLSALVLIVILNDIYSNKMHYIPDHLFLGVITCSLFFVICNYGLEQVNWVFLALILIVFFIKSLYTHPKVYRDNNDDCEVCQTSTDNYTPPPNPVRQHSRICSIGCNDSSSDGIAATAARYKPSELNCPGNPVVLPTACGITRYA